jgi:hypothetical protein
MESSRGSQTPQVQGAFARVNWRGRVVGTNSPRGAVMLNDPTAAREIARRDPRAWDRFERKATRRLETAIADREEMASHFPEGSRDPFELRRREFHSTIAQDYKARLARIRSMRG